jgi:multicomponent Na+:H+ antiporter subunit E
VHLLPGLIRYTPWLIGQIIQSSLHVARRVLNPKLPISPTIIHIDTQQTDALNSVSYANSITLTPGTISLDVGKDQIEVHALTSESAESLKSGLMAKQVRKMEGVR